MKKLIEWLEKKLISMRLQRKKLPGSPERRKRVKVNLGGEVEDSKKSVRKEEQKAGMDGIKKEEEVNSGITTNGVTKEKEEDSTIS